MLTGGCFCGRIRYEASGTPFNATSCHCTICRRTTGAPFVTWFSVRRSEFRLIGLEPARFRSSAQATRSFCPECGTQITFEPDRAGDEIDVTICSLDEPHDVGPADHTYTETRLAWVKLADGLPEFPQSRSQD